MTTVGIDEVGRGPIAGPVTVCAFVGYTVWLRRESKKFNTPLRDSKKLSLLQREAWFEQITLWKKVGKCDFAVTSISASMIDKIGIAPAIRKALAISLDQLQVTHQTKSFSMEDSMLHQNTKNRKRLSKEMKQKCVFLWLLSSLKSRVIDIWFV